MYKVDLHQLKPLTESTDSFLEGTGPEKRPLTQLETVLKRLVKKKPLMSTRVQNAEESVILSWKFCSNGKRVIFGFKNGHIRVQMLKTAFDFSDFKEYWSFPFQDTDRGCVNCVQLTHDDRFVKICFIIIVVHSLI